MLNAMNDRINKIRSEFVAIVKDHDFNLNAKVDLANDEIAKLHKAIEAINIIDDKQ
jgi:hypothetical protein